MPTKHTIVPRRQRFLREISYRVRECAALGADDLTTHRAGFPLLAIFFLAVIGCGPSDRLPTYNVSGTVVFDDGSVLQAGTILFISPEHKMAARGLIKKGAFTLGTYETADGAVAGVHQVAVIPAPPEGYDPDSGRAPPTAKAKYFRPETSGLKFEVKADGVNEFKIQVERGR